MNTFKSHKLILSITFIGLLSFAQYTYAFLPAVNPWKDPCSADGVDTSFGNSDFWKMICNGGQIISGGGDPGNTGDPGGTEGPACSDDEQLALLVEALTADNGDASNSEVDPNSTGEKNLGPIGEMAEYFIEQLGFQLAPDKKLLLNPFEVSLATTLSAYQNLVPFAPNGFFFRLGNAKTMFNNPALPDSVDINFVIEKEADGSSALSYVVTFPAPIFTIGPKPTPDLEAGLIFQGNLENLSAYGAQLSGVFTLPNGSTLTTEVSVLVKLLSKTSLLRAAIICKSGDTTVIKKQILKLLAEMKMPVKLSMGTVAVQNDGVSAALISNDTVGNSALNNNMPGGIRGTIPFKGDISLSKMIVDLNKAVLSIKDRLHNTPGR